MYEKLNRLSIVAAMLLAPALLGVAAPALAQSGVEGRVGKLESEMRAVQRKVFRGAACPRSSRR